MQKKITAALIIDNSQIKKWQKSSLLEVQDLIDVKLVLNCNNTKSKKKIFKHFIYYVLNIFTLKNSFTRNIKYKNTNAIWINFKSIINGNWQTIPSEIIKKVHSTEVKLIIKFGMGLIDVQKTNCSAPILSYHHGDPSKYRGRPPGFFEILDMEKNCGSIVQVLTNKLDGGQILAINHSKIFHYSYKKTLENLFFNSRYLLGKAILNLVKNNSISINSNGKSYKLPNNALTIKFIVVLLIRKIKRYFYGLFIEKQWNIILYEGNIDKENLDVDKIYSIDEGKSPELTNNYVFFADPFFSQENNVNIYAEGLNKWNGLGEIVLINSNNFKLKKIKLKGNGHFAYPQCINIDCNEWILPEISDHSRQRIFNVKENESIDIKIEGKNRLIDATMYKKDEIYYLFCGHMDNSLDNLFLYFSDTIHGPYKNHPSNPIVSNPLNARMAGNILKKDKDTYRFGQNNCYGYGEKITVNKIKKISTKIYEEEVISEVCFKERKGPHTINFSRNKIVLDFYNNKFSLFAGYRRLIPKLLKIRNYF